MARLISENPKSFRIESNLARASSSSSWAEAERASSRNVRSWMEKYKLSSWRLEVCCYLSIAAHCYQ